MSSATLSQRLTAAVQPDNQHSTSRMTARFGALLLYLPFGMWFAESYLPFMIVGAAVAMGVAELPDKLTSRFISFETTHSIVGAVLVGIVVAAVSWWLAANVLIHADGAVVTPGSAGKFGFTVGALAGFGHVLGDCLTGTDVPVLAPVSDRWFSINLLQLLNPRNNEGFNLVGTLLLVSVVVALASSGATATMFP